MKLVTAALIVLLFPLVDAGSKTGRSSRRVKYVLDTKEGEGNGAEQVSPYFNRLDTGTLPRRMKVDSSGDCFVDVSLTCTPKNNETESCDHLFSSAKTASCESPPSEVEFGFLGGNCPNSTRVRNDGFLNWTVHSIPNSSFSPHNSWKAMPSLFVATSTADQSRIQGKEKKLTLLLRPLV